MIGKKNVTDDIPNSKPCQKIRSLNGHNFIIKNDAQLHLGIFIKKNLDSTQD